MRLEDELTILSVTHYSPLEEYGELAPPTAGIIEKTVESLRANFEGSESCPHHLYYNYPTRNVGDGSEAYERHLEELAQRKGLILHKTPNNGLRDTLLEAMERISSPYVFFVEHDWEFLENVNTAELIETFEENPDVNHVRFNKFENSEGHWDTIVREDRSKRIPLCKVSTYSNNPHVVRRSKYEEWLERAKPDLSYWLHLYQSGTWPNSIHNLAQLVLRSYVKKHVLREGHVRYLDDVEVVIDKRYKALIDEVGFSTAHAEMGTYLYGPKHTGPYVEHLGK